MSIYLHDIPLADAWMRFEQALRDNELWGVLGSEDIPLNEHALGRALTEPVWAKISVPHYHAAAMDGFALRSVDSLEASLAHPVRLTCGINGAPLQARLVDTGDPLPDWADCVVPIENCEPQAEDGVISKDIRRPWAILIRETMTPWRHVRLLGEDMIASQLVVPSGRVLRPVDLGAIAASGNDKVRVARQPLVAILPTGNELIPIGQPVEPGQIIEFNSIMLAAQVEQWGGKAIRSPIITDQLEAIRRQVQIAAEKHDLILLNAGSSAGSEDFSAPVIESLGTLLVHGVAVRPGHPVIIGLINRLDGRKPVPIIGIPGYPVSAALTGEIFVEPLLAHWLGRQPIQPITVAARLTRKVTSPAGDDDFLRVSLGRVGDRVLASPLPRGAGIISSLARADGLTLIPSGTQGVMTGAEVQVRLYCSPNDIENSILAIGSHDMTLDLLAQYLTSRNRHLVSANVGSLGGLIALQRGEAHLAGCHLMDPETGEYNRKYINQYLPDQPVVRLLFVRREQGLVIQPGNPKAISGFEDFTRPDVRLVNRQRGAGTRVLLDFHLERLGIPSQKILGYDTEEYTHLGVAVAVASGRADVGLAIAAAADALGLDFIPLYSEPYELIIPMKFYTDKLIQPLLDLCFDPAFREAVSAMRGYDVSRMGEIVPQFDGER